MKNKYIIASSIVAFAVLLVATTATSAAFGGDGWGKNLNPEQKQEMQEKKAEWKAEKDARRAEMQTIMDGGDYEAWKTAVEERQAKRFNILDVINEDNFDKLVEMHNLKQAGDIEGAKAIAEELGLPGIGQGQMRRHMGGMKMGHLKNNINQQK